MDDRLQRRLRDADPLTVGDGQLPAPARLDAIKEQLMLSETQGAGRVPGTPEAPGTPGTPAPRRHVMRPRAIGITALAASGLAAVLVAGTLLQPTGSALAWDPSPTAATPAQEAAAKAACAIPEMVPPAGEAGTVEGGQVTVGGPSVTLPDGAQGGAVGVTGGAQVPGGVITESTGGVMPPPFPTELPPLVYLELHGTGAVAILADEDTTAYCLLVKRDDGFELAGLHMPLGDGGSAGVGVIGAIGVAGGVDGASAGPTMSGMTLAGEGDFQVMAMATDYGNAKVGIMAGSAPEGAAKVIVKGGAADGATASVTDGRFALWAPRALDTETTIVALDASGAEIGSVKISGAPPEGAPVMIELEPEP